MQIEIHGLYVVIHSIPLDEVKYLCDEILKIKYYSMLATGKSSNTSKLIKKFAKAQESVCIKRYGANGDVFTTVNLHGTFFECSKGFKFVKFLTFVSMYKHTFKQLDIAFNDNNRCLSKKEVIHWCNYPDDYCTGSLVDKLDPDIGRKRRKTHIIKLGNAKSTISYGTIYRRPELKRWRFEIKFKSNDKIMYLIEKYSEIKPQQFHKRCLRFLVGCINFVTPQSKKNGKLYKKQKSWLAFLESDIKKINWSQIQREKRNNRTVADKEMSDRQIKRTASMLRNLVNRLKVDYPEKEVIKRIEEFSGYNLVKNTNFSSDD
jgi:hypothetical protein